MLRAISFGRLLPFGAFDEPDHAVEEGGARRGGDAHAYPVGKHLRAAGDGRAIAAEFANDRRRFPSDGGFVDRSHALDHLSVGRNDVAGFNQHDVIDLELRRGNQPIALRIVRAGYQLGLGFGALPPQRFGLSLAPTLGDRFGEVGEQHREPQPQDDLEFETDVFAAGREITDQNHSRQHGDNFEHEHHRILHQRPRIELHEGGADRRHDDLRIKERRYRHALAQGRGFHGCSDLICCRKECAGVDRQLFDDRPKRQRREEGEAADDDDDADHQTDEQPAGGRKSAC